MFKGQVGIIVGGGSGLGRALALELAPRLAQLWIADLDESRANETARMVRERGGHAETRHIDATDAAAVQVLVDEVTERAGRLDLMVNCVGRGFWGPAIEATEQQWREAFETNLWSVVHGTLAAYRQMARQRQGRIVNVASLAGLIPVPATTPYAAAKHAVVGFSQSLRAEAARHGVIVQVACPGPFQSGFFSSLMSSLPGDAPRPAPRGAITAAQAARELLRSIERNEPLIVFPRSARWRWRLARWWPKSLARLERRLAAALPERPVEK